MKLIMFVCLGASCLLAGRAHALDPVPAPGLANIRSSAHPSLAEDSLTATRDRRLGKSRARDAQLRDQSPFAKAIGSAASRSIVERSVEAYTEVLIQCQKATSPALTTALMRSNAQQDHCYRF